MPITNKALRLSRFRDLTEIFKDNKDVLGIVPYSNMDKLPFGHRIYIKKGLDSKYIKALEQKGFEIAAINIKKFLTDNGNFFGLEIQTWKYPIEKMESDSKWL